MVELPAYLYHAVGERPPGKHMPSYVVLRSRGGPSRLGLGYLPLGAYGRRAEEVGPG